MNRYIQEYTKNQMSEKRFNHSVSVSKIAGELARIHHENIENAATAGLLHDLAREWDFDVVFDFLNSRNVEISEDQKNVPILLHGLVASLVINEKLDISDIDIINSVKNHTLGRKDMSSLEKIIFISDYLSSAEGTDRYRVIFDSAAISLNNTLLLIYESTHKYLTDNGLFVANEFYENWKHYQYLEKN